MYNNIRCLTLDLFSFLEFLHLFHGLAVRIFIGALYDLFVFSFVELLEGLVFKKLVHKRFLGLAGMSLAIMIEWRMLDCANLEVLGQHLQIVLLIEMFGI